MLARFFCQLLSEAGLDYVFGALGSDIFAAPAAGSASHFVKNQQTLEESPRRLGRRGWF